MQNTRKITNDLYFIGAQDKKLNIFEALYPLTDGMGYNSYLLIDDKTVLFDTVDKNCESQFFENLDYLLKDKPLDYFIINHLEPDHSALAKKIIDKYPNIKILCNQKAKDMLFQFFEFNNDSLENNFQIIKENDTLKTQHHEFTFLMAPMVHWPEVMVTYDKTEKILFSADAFGSFGTLDGNIFDDEINFKEKIDEYRRYYTNIVGKFGPQVNALLNKAANIDIKMLCPLHGYIIKENIGNIIELYKNWANYTPEIKSLYIIYASIYGATQNAAYCLANALAQNGIKNIKIDDVSLKDTSYIISNAFKYSHIALLAPTHNNNIFPKMNYVIDELINHNLQNRTFALVQNGSWAPNTIKSITTKLEAMKNIKILDNSITVKSALKSNQENEIEVLAQAIAQDINTNI